MSSYSRPKITGATVFFTVNLTNRKSDLLLHQIKHLREVVRQTQAERPFHIAAWVVLPDHMHCIWTLPRGDADYATRWRILKSRFSRGMQKGQTRQSHLARNERGIWQRRFWEHHIRDQADYDAHIRYCWINPVKHGFVTRAADWPYSSIHRDIRLGMVEPEWSGAVPQGAFGE